MCIFLWVRQRITFQATVILRTPRTSNTVDTKVKKIFKLLLFHPEQIKRKESCGFLAAVTDDKMFVTTFTLTYSVMVIQLYKNMSKRGLIFNFVIGYGVTFSSVLLNKSLDSNLLQHCTHAVTFSPQQQQSRLWRGTHFYFQMARRSVAEWNGPTWSWDRVFKIIIFNLTCDIKNATKNSVYFCCAVKYYHWKNY